MLPDKFKSSNKLTYVSNPALAGSSLELNVLIPLYPQDSHMISVS